jgi:hypothetical protein
MANAKFRTGGLQASGFVASSVALTGSWLYSIVSTLLMAEVAINTMCEVGRPSGISITSQFNSDNEKHQKSKFGLKWLTLSFERGACRHQGLWPPAWR